MEKKQTPLQKQKQSVKNWKEQYKELQVISLAVENVNKDLKKQITDKNFWNMVYKFIIGILIIVASLAFTSCSTVKDIPHKTFSSENVMVKNTIPMVKDHPKPVSGILFDISGAMSAATFVSYALAPSPIVFICIGSSILCSGTGLGFKMFGN